MDNAVSVENLSVSYSGIEAVNNINLEIKKGEFLGITGPNGGGKTTVLSAILGLIKTDCGEIKIQGKNITEGRKQIGFVPQTVSVDRQFPISVIETVMTAFLNKGIEPFKIFGKAEKAKAMETLELIGLKEKAEKQISELSGGEFQRLLIARALAAEPEILFLDEPTSNIDTHSRNSIYGILSKLNQNGATIVMVTHDLQNISDMFSRLICINRTVVFDGSPKDFLNSKGGHGNACGCI